MDYNFNGKRILLADDDEINLLITEKLLREHNAEVVSVRDGAEAIDTYRDEHGKFDLLILDLVMPKMGGMDVALNIRTVDAIPSAIDVPIITMTAHKDHYNPLRAEIAGIVSHFNKPIEPDDLLQAISDCI